VQVALRLVCSLNGTYTKLSTLRRFKKSVKPWTAQVQGSFTQQWCGSASKQGRRVLRRLPRIQGVTDST